MSAQNTLDEKVYHAGPAKISMRELLQYFLSKGPMRVSDLHIKVGSPPVYRVDGKLERMKGSPLDAETASRLIASVLSATELERLGRDGSVDASVQLGGVCFRLNGFRDMDGPALAVRALEATIPAPDKIGFPNGVWQDILVAQQGLVLVTGITGAGKSTTIASLIDAIARQRACRIITLEEPIEYHLHGPRALISQREVGRDVPSFERGLRDCLREDPDVIFVGEMRDRESAAWTLTAAETGHLVFSTLHTRDCRGTLTRVLDMFPSERQDEVAGQLSLGLRYVICQKLLPRSDGQGRVVAMEILQNTYALANLIRQAKVEQVYSQLQTKTRDIPEERMTTMEKSLVRLVREGVVAPLEAEKWANDRNAFQGEMHSE
jgi:twitching motility protein PilT